ncbi:MAG: permease [Lentisphaerae bacterium]|nr:permease [Lentisphaerota bacterium]
MKFALHVLTECWNVTGEMAPYLLFGFLMAGVLSVLISPEFIEEHLGGRGMKQVLKASLFGVPLPLCSCSVLPVAASLRRHGAGRGATLSFLISTPQTGVDSIMVTHGLLGPVFAVFRVAVAFISGIVGGAVLELFDRNGAADAEAGGQKCCCAAHGDSGGRFWRAVRYGFVTLPREIGRAMLVGIVISGALTAVVPPNYFADRLGGGLLSMLVMMVVGIPIYVCSSGSVPIALAMMRMGVSPGAAFVFLVTGPATNSAAVTTVWKLLGRAGVAAYLLTIASLALASGLLLDFMLPAGAAARAAECHGPGSPAGWFLAVLLLIVLAPSLLPARGAAGERETEDR